MLRASARTDIPIKTHRHKAANKTNGPRIQSSTNLSVNSNCLHLQVEDNVKAEALRASALINTPIKATRYKAANKQMVLTFDHEQILA